MSGRNQIYQGFFALPNPYLMESRVLTVEEYFRDLEIASVANLNGKPIPNNHWEGIIRGAWNNIPHLKAILNRFTPAQRATLDAIREATRAALFPDGQPDLHHKDIRKFWSRKQGLVEHPPQSGNLCPESIRSYTESKRELAAKIPDAHRPNEETQIRDLIEGLHPVLKGPMSTIDTPATMEDCVTRLLKLERAMQVSPDSSATVPLITSTSQPMLGPVIQGAPTGHYQHQQGTMTGHPGSYSQPQAYGPPPPIPVFTTMATPPPPPPPPPMTLQQDLQALKESVSEQVSQQVTQFQAMVNTILADRSGAGRQSSGHAKYGPTSDKAIKYCHECDREGHDETNCWGPCEVCGMRGHPSRACRFARRPGRNGNPNRNGQNSTNHYGSANRNGGGHNNNRNQLGKRRSEDRDDLAAVIAEQVAKAIKVMEGDIARRSREALDTSGNRRNYATTTSEDEEK